MTNAIISLVVALGLLMAVADAFPKFNLNERACSVKPLRLNSTQINDFLSTHNRYRAADAAESGKSIPAMTWSNELAELSQAWSDELANTNSFAHGNLYKCNGERVGQNLWKYGSTSQTGLPSPVAAVKSWYDEKVYYNYASNTCASGKVCGHYTQVVWNKSTQLGCAAANYKSGSWFYLVVTCDYYVAGNNGNRPF